MTALFAFGFLVLFIGGQVPVIASWQSRDEAWKARQAR